MQFIFAVYFTVYFNVLTYIKFWWFIVIFIIIFNLITNSNIHARTLKRWYFWYFYHIFNVCIHSTPNKKLGKCLYGLKFRVPNIWLKVSNSYPRFFKMPKSFIKISFEKMLISVWNRIFMDLWVRVLTWFFLSSHVFLWCVVFWIELYKNIHKETKTFT